MKRYNKLVRDKIPDIIRKKGGKPKYHIAWGYEYWAKLKEKLGEEGGELMEAINNFISTEEGEKKLIEETADFLEVLDAVLCYSGEKGPPATSRLKHILSIKVKKAKERGRFKKRIILEEA